MKLFKIQKTDLNHDGEFYNEGSQAEFDEKNKSIKKLVANGILVEVKMKAEAGDDKGKDKGKDKIEEK